VCVCVVCACVCKIEPVDLVDTSLYIEGPV